MRPKTDIAPGEATGLNWSWLGTFYQNCSSLESTNLPKQKYFQKYIISQRECHTLGELTVWWPWSRGPALPGSEQALGPGAPPGQASLQAPGSFGKTASYSALTETFCRTPRSPLPAAFSRLPPQSPLQPHLLTHTSASSSSPFLAWQEWPGPQQEAVGP